MILHLGATIPTKVQSLIHCIKIKKNRVPSLCELTMDVIDQYDDLYEAFSSDDAGIDIVFDHLTFTNKKIHCNFCGKRFRGSSPRFAVFLGTDRAGNDGITCHICSIKCFNRMDFDESLKIWELDDNDSVPLVNKLC